MSPDLRLSTPLLAGTADDAGLPPPIPFDPAQAGPSLPETRLEVMYGSASADPFAPPPGTPAWLGWGTGLIRPICVGALMAIPTVGAAAVGLVALASGPAAARMSSASIGFLAGIPDGVLLLIGSLAGGYTLAKSFERVLAWRGR